MKPHILSLLLLLAAGTAAQAQSAPRFGLKAGVSSATYAGKDNTATTAKIGVNAGITLNLGLTDQLSIQPEVLFSQKGTKLSYNQDNSDVTVFLTNGNAFGRKGSGTYTQTLNYLDVPVLLRYNIGPTDGAGFFVEAGPQVSFLLSQRGEVSGDKATVVLAGPTRNDINSPRTELPCFTVDNTTADLNTTTFGYALGVGYRFSNALSLSARYTGDFSRAYKSGEGKAEVLKPYRDPNVKFTNPEVRNSAFQVQVGYVLGGN
ncbi:PorT family protein [Hymenobacter sp. 5317J-9]|uniref:porin family protein n=1 Tax=Hymenobacter sp. 5317J-9 TaxID=2932250 RepID=UPI001FD653A5|nr:porin family protein [Hymenobacter sp. 5317J-9]UOQ97521.1 PorT family protein [Hymenobacter sp. 5317J-9]